MRRKTGSSVRVNTIGLSRRKRNIHPQPVPTFQPDPKAPPSPQAQVVPKDEAIEAAINRMVEAAYT